MRSWLVPLAVFLLLAGCDYEAPLSTEHVVPVDPAFLGTWEMVPETDEDRASGDMGPLVVLRFSATEYLVHDPGGHFYRAFRVDLGGHRCLQLEDLGSGTGPAPESRRYLVGRCEDADADGFTLSLLNEKHVPSGAKPTAELRAAFLAARDAPDLFEPVARFRRRLLPDLALPAPEPGAARDHVETAAFGPGGRRLVVGLRSGHVAALDLVTGRLAWSVAAHEEPVHAIAFGDTDRWVLTAADDLRATLRRGDTGGEFLSFEAAPLRKVYEIALSSDAAGSTVAAAGGSADGRDTVWLLDPADGRFLAASSSDGQIVRIDAAGRSIVDKWRLPEGLVVEAVGFAGADVWVTSFSEAAAGVRRQLAGAGKG